MRGWPWSRTPRLALGHYGPRPFARTLRLPIEELRSHLQISGVTGSGKTRLLAQLFLELYRQGQAVTLLDPHGDASRLILRQLVAQGPDRQDATMDRLVYLDLPGAAAAGHYLPFNVLRQPHLDPHTSARSVLEALRRAWPSLDEGQAPAFENVILASVFVLIVNRLPLTRLQDVLLDAGWREQLLARVEDETVLGFFRGRLARWGRERALLVESSLRRIFLLAFAPVLRHSLGQEENLLDLRQLMDDGRSLIVNLALPDPDARRLLGCLLTVGFEQAALSRASQPAAERGPDHVLLLDEFAEFASQSATSLARMLALCRKFGLSLALAHQTWSQTSASLQGALQNAGVTISFRLGRADAERAARLFGRVDPLAIKHDVPGSAQGRVHPLFSPLAEQWETGWVQTLQTLPDRAFLLRRANGAVLRLRTLDVPDPPVTPEALQRVERRYRRRYFRAPSSAASTRGPSQHTPGHTTRIAWLPPDERDISDISYAKYQKNGA